MMPTLRLCGFVRVYTHVWILRRKKLVILIRVIVVLGLILRRKWRKRLRHRREILYVPDGTRRTFARPAEMSELLRESRIRRALEMMCIDKYKHKISIYDKKEGGQREPVK